MYTPAGSVGTGRKGAMPDPATLLVLDSCRRLVRLVRLAFIPEL
jgi:hypothetical protein